MVGTSARSLPRSREGGFTLLEALFATMVLAFGLVVLLQSMLGSYRLGGTVREQEIAVQFASARLESIRTMRYAQVAAAPPAGYRPASFGTTSLAFSQDVDGDGDSDRFGRFFSGNPVAANYDPLLLGLTPPTAGGNLATVSFRDPDGSTGVGEGMGYWVTVTVAWRGNGGLGTVSLSTFLADRGL